MAFICTGNGACRGNHVQCSRDAAAGAPEVIAKVPQLIWVPRTSNVDTHSLSQLDKRLGRTDVCFFFSLEECLLYNESSHFTD